MAEIELLKLGDRGFSVVFQPGPYAQSQTSYWAILGDFLIFGRRQGSSIRPLDPSGGFSGQRAYP